MRKYLLRSINLLLMYEDFLIHTDIFMCFFAKFISSVFRDFHDYDVIIYMKHQRSIVIFSGIDEL